MKTMTWCSPTLSLTLLYVIVFHISISKIGFFSNLTLEPSNNSIEQTLCSGHGPFL